MAGPADTKKKAAPPQAARGPGQPEIITDTPENRERLKRYGSVHTTLEEVAIFFGVHYKTIENVFKRYPELKAAYELGKAEFKQTLRRAQVELAIEQKNPQMLIWLGKSVLGQRDDIVINVDAQYVVGIKAAMFEDEEAFEREFIDVTPTAPQPKKLNGNGANKLPV